MNKKDYQTPAVRIVAVRAAAILNINSNPDAQVHNSVGRSDAQFSRGSGDWFDEEGE